MSAPASDRPTSSIRQFWRVLRVQLALAAGLFASAVYGLVRYTRHEGDDFSQIAYDEFLGAMAIDQLRVVPAYLIVALAYAFVAFPLLDGRRVVTEVRGWRGWARLGGVTFLLDALLGVLSFGVFFRRNPGLLDGFARKLSVVSPDVNVYAVYNWHLLDVAAWVLWALVAWAGVFYLRHAWAATRDRHLAWRLAPLVAVGLGAWAARTPAVPIADGDRPLNVLVIAADSLRYDHLGVHGYERADISPNIDAFAADALDFQQLHVATASTLESWLTLMASQFPPNHGIRYMYLRRDQAQAASALPDLLPRVLNDAGYRTSVVSNWAGNCFKLVDVGFTHNLASDTQNFRSLLMEHTVWAHFIFPLYFSNDLGEWLLPEVTRTTKYLRPGALGDKMLGQIDDATRAEQPFFGLLFYSTTHLPYTASYPFNVKYTDPDYRGAHRYQIDVTVHDLITSGFAPNHPPETLQHIKDLYDGAVSEFDAYVGSVIAELKARNLYDRTIIIVTSDHGEDLYDRGSTLGHGTNFLGGDQSTRIPFFVRIPGVTRPGTAFTGLSRNIDVAPTLLGALDLAAPDSWQGVDLAEALEGTRDDFDLPVFGETCYLFFPKSKALVDLTPTERARVIDTSSARDTLTIDRAFDNNMVLRADLHDEVIATKDRMVRTRRWKLIEIPAVGEPIYRLYDMQADPGQTQNLARSPTGDVHPIMPRLIDALRQYWAGNGAAQRWPVAWEQAPSDPEEDP